jgi:hypothetical protein
MSREYEYAIIQLADRVRGERLNAGLAIFSDLGLDLRLPRRLEKLRAISAALDLDGLRSNIENLAAFDRILLDDGVEEAAKRIEALGHLSTFIFSSVSHFAAHSNAAYEDVVAKLLQTLVEPEPARVKPVRKRTRLVSVLRQALRRERVLARPGEDLSAHRVVANLQIAEGLAADFVLKNGAMHIIETVDASEDDFSPKRVVSDIAISALVLEQSRMTFGSQDTTTRIVYDTSAAAERIAMPSLMAAAHQGAELVNWASQDDRNKLIVGLSAMATPLESKKSDSTNINASTQPRLSLH